MLYDNMTLSICQKRYWHVKFYINVKVGGKQMKVKFKDEGTKEQNKRNNTCSTGYNNNCANYFSNSVRKYGSWSWRNNCSSAKSKSIC